MAAKTEAETDAVAAESRYPSLIYNASARATYQPRVEPNDFGSIEIRRKFFTPPVPGFGPRTIPRGATHTPTGPTVPAGAAFRPTRPAGS